MSNPLASASLFPSVNVTWPHRPTLPPIQPRQLQGQQQFTSTVKQAEQTQRQTPSTSLPNAHHVSNDKVEQDFQANLSPLLRHLTLHLLPSLSGSVHWMEKRDLPPMLIRPIRAPSPVLLHAWAWMRGVARDMAGSVNDVATDADEASNICQRNCSAINHFALHLFESLKECYLTLGTPVLDDDDEELFDSATSSNTSDAVSSLPRFAPPPLSSFAYPSRFHSRQHWVDLATLLLCARSCVQGMEGWCAESDVKQDGQGSVSWASMSAINQLHLVCIELAAAVLITHPKLLSLHQIDEMLQAWETQWMKESTGTTNPTASSLPPSSSTSSSPASESPSIPSLTAQTMAPFAAAVAPLWQCAPCRFERQQLLGFSDSDSLHSFIFGMPTLFAVPKQADDDNSGQSQTETMQTNVTEDLTFPVSAADALSLFLPSSSSSFSPLHQHFPRRSLLRVVYHRRELREDDYPPLSEEEENVAKAIRQRLHAMEEKWINGS